MSLEFVIIRTINESKRSPAKTFLPREQAEELYQAGLGVWNKKLTALTLKRVEHEMWKPAPSLTPGKLIHDFVDGCELAIAAVNSYAREAAL